MPFITSVSDQQIYSWTEFKLNHPTWWTIFRISCYLICIIQLSIYTIYLKRIIKEHESKAKFKNGKIILILCICVVYFISNLMVGYIFDILFYLTTIMLGGYIIWNKKISRIIMHELKSIFPRIANLPTHSKRVPQLNEKQKDAVFIWLHKADNSKSKVNLKILAKEILINPATLSKFFKEEIGGSFANYIASRRLDNFEKSLLDNKQDDKSVIEKAEETGFQSSASFYRAFLKRHQVSPLKWKEQILNETRQTDNS
ncbi:helix-turn-helix domain-containing protein [uncultured Bacteroides sp.]|uniref:AraC family transcriptional regulator n=1 Tax=uncultured Bacteroides sp. TaxID=162156 RepID=UPI0025E016DB|nr:helix-turn-helix domain-containing protein [uncultured Bacteroides sp.]